MHSYPSRDEDFFAWTQDQAAALRALPSAIDGCGVDVAHIAAEIEDLGRRDVREIESSLRKILTSLLEIAALPQAKERAHWLAEIEECQARIVEIYKPSMEKFIDFDRAWALAKRAATTIVAEMNDGRLDAPAGCPFELDELVSEDFDVRAAQMRMMNAGPKP